MNAMLAGYMFGIIGNTLSSGLARPYCCYWNLQTDEFRLLDSGCLYDLLEKYPDLYENYLAEPEPGRKKTLEDYFIEYLIREKPELLKSVPRKAGSGYNSRNHANDRTGAETKTKRITTGSGQRMKRNKRLPIGKANRNTHPRFRKSLSSAPRTVSANPFTAPSEPDRTIRQDDSTKSGNPVLRIIMAKRRNSCKDIREPAHSYPAFLSHSLATVANL